MQLADLRETRFDCGTDFHPECSELQGALLTQARLSGASFYGARLQGAGLLGANLQGASLVQARLQGATLNVAQMQGAKLWYAGLEGASLWRAQLQGASFDYARLLGATLHGAQIQGASLDHAELQGADLTDADLDDASLVEAYVWRADVSSASLNNTRIIDPIIEQVFPGKSDQCLPKRLCPFGPEEYDALQQMIDSTVPEKITRGYAHKSLSRLDPRASFDREIAMADAWKKSAQSAPDLRQYQQKLASRLEDLGCNPNSAPNVFQGISNNGRLEATGREGPSLLSIFVDEKKCLAMRGLSVKEKERLHYWAEHAPKLAAP